MAQKFTVPITVKQLTSASSDAVTVYVDADTFARLKVEAGGRLVWGSGASAGDVNLYRASADVLQTDDTFKTPILFVDNIEIDPTGATTDQVLKFDGTKFIASTISSGGATNLDGLSDVVITSPTHYQILEYDGTNWVNNDASVTTYVRNAESTTLNIGEVVYLYQQQGDRASVKRAINTGDATSAKTLGVVAASIPASSDGPVVTQGYVYNCNLGSYTAGQTVYLSSTAGQITATKPYAPNHLVYVGVVVRANNGNGIIYVRAQNGYELDEIHDVDLITTPPTSGDFLKYNGTLWVNDKIDLGTDTNGNYVQNLVAGTGITLTNGTASEGGTPTVAVTANTYQPLDADLTAIAGLAGTSGVLKKTAADTWALDTSTFVTTSDTGSVTSAMIADGTIVNGDISASAAISHSKLANATAGQVLLGTTTTGVVTATTLTGDVTVTGGGVTAIGSGVIVDADINSAAAISLSKLSTIGASAGNVVTYNGSIWTAASVASGGSTVTASTTPPSSPSTGSIWFDSNTAKTYVYYDSFWVEIGGTSGGAKMYVSLTAPSSPAEGQLWFKSDTAQTFAYYDSFWVEVGAAGMAAIAADSAPASPVTGQIWFNTSTGGTYVYYDSYWIEVGAVAANTVFNLVDAKGDILVGTADNTLARQAVGTTGQLLRANSSATTGVEWFTPTYAPASAPTFTGTVVLPSTTSIGNVDSTEIGYLDGVTSAIQTQLNAKAPLAAPTFTGTPFFNGGTIGGTAGNSVETHRAYATQSNTEQLRTSLIKTSTGSDWTTSAWMMQRVVDVSNMGYVKLGSGIVALGDGTTDSLIVDSSGRVRMPYQPAFSAQLSNAATGGQDLVFGTANVNAGSCYNTSNGRFTAPVAGSYWFAFQTLMNNGATGEFRHALYKNNGGYGGLRFIFYKDAAGWQAVYAYGVIYLAANDYVTVRYESGSGAIYTDGNYSNFSGYLIG